ncbi:MAG: cupin domain-containing protein, partial [Chloroflexota bacterium]
VEIDPEATMPGRATGCEAKSNPVRRMHRHRGVEEVITIWEGAAELETPGRVLPAMVGDTIHVPADELHRTRNVGSSVLRLICFFPTGDVDQLTEESEGSADEGGRSGSRSGGRAEHG